MRFLLIEKNQEPRTENRTLRSAWFLVHGLDHASRHLKPGEGRPAALGLQAIVAQLVARPDLDLDAGIRLGRQVEDALGIRPRQLDQSLDGESPLVDGGQHQRQRRLQSGQSRRNVVAVLLVAGVRRVVGRDTVDIIEVLPQRHAIVGAGQAWTHIAEWPETRQVVAAKHQMMRRDLAGHTLAALLSGGDEFDLLARGHMRDMNRLRVALGDLQHTLQHIALGVRDDHLGCGPVGDMLIEQLPVVHAQRAECAVDIDLEGAGVRSGRRDLVGVIDAGTDEHADIAASVGTGKALLGGEALSAGGGRRRVGHVEHTGHAAGQCRCGAAGVVFFVLAAGLA
jgi:hypothetical protein